MPVPNVNRPDESIAHLEVSNRESHLSRIAAPGTFGRLIASKREFIRARLEGYVDLGPRRPLRGIECASIEFACAGKYFDRSNPEGAETKGEMDVLWRRILV